jgi:signal peptidase I
MAIDVHPPRASRWTKRWRRWMPTFGPVLYDLRDTGRRVTREGWTRIAGQLEAPSAPPWVLARMVVPGWAHFHLGQTMAGWRYLGGFLILLFLSLLFLGTVLGSIFLGLAYAVHVTACLSILLWGGLELANMRRGAVMVFLGLLALYIPAGWLVSRFASPVAINILSPPFEPGDVVLYNQSAFWFREPRPGQVVLYQQAQFTHMMTGPQHGQVWVQGGDRIDRILAGPGDKVLFEKGEIQVNGQPCLWQPLNPKRWNYRVQFQVPAGCYWILPTTGVPLPANIPEDLWPTLVRELTLVPTERIHGTVYLRHQPLSRLTLFQ